MRQEGGNEPFAGLQDDDHAGRILRLADVEARSNPAIGTGPDEEAFGIYQSDR